MKIVFIAYKLNFEGSGGSTTELDAKMRYLQSCGHEVTVVTLFSKQNHLIALHYKVLEEQAHSGSFWNLQKKTLQILRKMENQCDLFHLEGHFAAGSGWYKIRGGRNPVVVHFNRELTSFPESTRQHTHQNTLKEIKRKIRLSLDRVFSFPLINKNNAITFTSPVLESVYVGYGINQKIAHVIPDFFSSKDVLSNIATEEKTTNGKTHLLTGGRLVSEKGIDVILEAVSRIPKDLPWELTITGDGPEKENLQKFASSANISDKVRFVGWVSKDELYNLYQNADVYIVPRWRPELTSMLVLEAMAFGAPQIVTRDTAIAWQTGDSALTFADENAEELSLCIIELMQKTALRAQLSQKGRDRLKELDAEIVGIKLNDLITKLK